MKKNTKKTKSPEVIVDCINFETLNDLYDNHTMAKVRAGKPVTEEEVDNMVANNVGKALDVAVTGTIAACIACSCMCKPKKLPWYKRFWNWLRRK